MNPDSDPSKANSTTGGRPRRSERHRSLIGSLGFFLVLSSCAGPTFERQPILLEETVDEEMTVTSRSVTGRAPFVRVASDGRTFRRARERFVPWGVNYYDHRTGWPPRIWERFDPEAVEKHFDIMESLRVNCVRVFLTAQSFFPDGERLNDEAVSHLEEMLSIADRHDILVQLTGPDHWEGNPEWRQGDFFTEERALTALARFWGLFAARFRDDPRIFSFDILNEPHVRWSSPAMEEAWPKWLRSRYERISNLRKIWGDAAEKISKWEEAPIPEDTDEPGSPLLYDYQCFREDIGTNWVAVQSNAIRASDPNRLITVGLIQWSVPLTLNRPSHYAAVNPFRIAPYVDFMTFHFYPTVADAFQDDESFRRNLAYLTAAARYVDVGLPVVLGEYGWYGGGARPGMPPRTVEDQARWNRAVVETSFAICSGWFAWGFADTPGATDLSRYGGLVTEDCAVKPWGEEFRQMAKTMARNRPSYRSASKTLQPDYRMLLTSSEASQSALDEFQRLGRAFRRPGIRPHERLGE